MRVLRRYQRIASEATCAALDAGESVCVVAPPGSGKTTIFADVIVRKATQTLVVTHRRELVDQAAERLRAEGCRVGTIVASSATDPGAYIHVGTVQTLCNVARRPAADLVVWDECHHATTPEWAQVHVHYPAACLLGVTATPMRRDGTALGDVFSKLVVAASYSELIADGHLVPCPPANVWAPHPEATDYDLWQDPLRAWLERGEGRPTLAYASSVEQADKWHQAFVGQRIPAALLHGKTPAVDRAGILRSFRDGTTRVIWSVGVLTEGTDIPCASCILLARAVDHQSTYLQIVGRGLRPYPGKRDCLLLDLTGATLRHGLPTEPRIYSLHGDPITLASPTRLRQCYQCGRVTEGTKRTCPFCGYQAAARDARAPVIRDEKLANVYAAQETPDDAKRAEWIRLLGTMRRKGHSIEWAIRQWRQLFVLRGGKELPDMNLVEIYEKKKQYASYSALARSNGWSEKFASVRYKALFGSWPSREVTS